MRVRRGDDQRCAARCGRGGVLDFCSSVDYQMARSIENCARGTNATIKYGNYPSDEELGIVTIDWEWLGEQKEALMEKWTDHWAR